MRTFLVLICSLALACAAGGAQDKNKSKKQAPKKNQTQSAQHAAASSSGPRKTKGSQRVTTVGAGAQKTKKAKGSQQIATQGGQIAGGAAGVQKTKKSKGSATNAYYAYDGPIYGYNNLPPDQVIANVQTALQQQGYYQGEVDGLLGPLTRAAVANYQRDHGLYITSAIDRPTLSSLGMT